MAISRAQMMKELLPGLNALFGLEYKQYTEEHTAIYESESSDRSFEEEQMLSGFGGAPVKEEGKGVSYDRAQEHYTARYTHETIAMGFAITEEAMEDNLYESLSARYIKALARGMAHTKQVKGMFVLNNAFTTANFQSGDGAALCSLTHPRVDGGTYRNRLTTPADLSEASLEQAVIDISEFVDDRGLLIAAQPKRLIVSPNNMFTATRILETEFRVGTNDNDINALRSNGSVPGGFTVNHYYTSTNKSNWFLTTDCPDGMKHFTRVALSQDMDPDFDTGNYRYKARERYSFGVSDPRGIFGSGQL